MTSPTVAWSAFVYLAFVTVIGIWAAGRTRTPRDFFIAGQNVGWVVLTMATMSAAFSGFVFLGGPGLMYRIGMASVMIIAPVGLTGGLLCWVVGKRLRLLAGLEEIYTIPDLFLSRFGSRRVSGLAALAVFVGTVGYLGAQLQALGLIVQLLAGDGWIPGRWGLAAAMAIGAIVVMLYSAAGGMVAGVYTDVVQGVLMIGAAVAVFVLCLRVGGGFGAMSRAIVDSPSFGARHLDPLGTVPVMTAFGFFFVFSIGILGQPHMLHKFFMLDDPADLKWMPLILGAAQSVCLLIWLGIGLTVPALVATGRLAPLIGPDEASPRFLLEFAPPWLAGLVFAGALAAIMSTADSFINIGSAALVRDLPKALGRRCRNELLWGRIAVVALTLVSVVFAWFYGDLIALLGTFAFGTFAAALAPAVVIGLHWRRVTAEAAGASILVGLTVNLGLEAASKLGFLERWSSAGMLPSATALATSFFVLILLTSVGFGRRDRPSSPALDFLIDLEG